MLTMPYLDVPGAKLYYEVDGPEDAPALVFIHAGIAHLRMWDPQIPHYAGRFRVIRYDTRGFGKTFSEATAFSNRADLRALLDHLGVERAVIVGCSRGGNIALDFALESPERAQAVVMVCSAPPPPQFEPPDDEAALDERIAELDEAGQHHERIEAELKMWVIGARRDAAALSPGYIEAFRQMGIDNLAHLEKPAPTPITLQPPSSERLGEIAFPLLIITGEEDESFARAGAAHVVAHVPSARTVMMPDTAHVPNFEHPARFNTILDDFLREIGA
jgi:pimeloyl-ACP methyl ester carboxylesterase